MTPDPVWAVASKLLKRKDHQREDTFEKKVGAFEVLTSFRDTFPRAYYQGWTET